MPGALGLIETIGFATAVAAVDAATKAARVEFLGYERVIGAGEAVSITAKLEGEVAAVQAAVDAGRAAAERVGKILSVHVIPRPHEQMEDLVHSRETRESVIQRFVKNGEEAGTVEKPNKEEPEKEKSEKEKPNKEKPIRGGRKNG